MLVYYDAAGRLPWQPSAASLSDIFGAFDVGHNRLSMLFLASSAGHSFRALLDSGASINLICESLARKLNLDILACADTITLGTGSAESVIGRCMLSAVYIDQACLSGLCYVVPTLTSEFDLIFGSRWFREHSTHLSFQEPVHARLLVDSHWHTLKPVPSLPCQDVACLSAAQLKRLMRQGLGIFAAVIQPAAQHCSPRHSLPPAIQQLLGEYADVMPDKLPAGLPPSRGFHHCIPLSPGSQVPQGRSYRLSPKEFLEAQRQVGELLALGLVQFSSSPFCSPVLFVPKKDTDELRMVIDYRALNRITVPNKYPMPRIDDLLDRLQGAQYFSSLDLMSGYHQIRIADSDVPKTAFRTPQGLFEFKVLSFGLTNAPATFQGVMNHIFSAQLNRFVIVYLDDILVFSKSAEEHGHHLREIFAVLREHRLYAKLSKCTLCTTELHFLGYIITQHGIAADPAKTSAVAEWLVPSTVKQVRSFLGLANYYRKFVPNFSRIAAVLNNLTKKDVTFSWTAECQQAFEALKSALCTAPVLALPDLAKPYEVITDASGFALGAVLQQEGRPVAFASRRMTPAERNYHPGEQELLAAIFALQQWRCYLEGADFVLVTDHHPNTFLPTKQDLSGRQARWVEYLQRFQFCWRYRPGSINVADPLSRSTVFQQHELLACCLHITPCWHCIAPDSAHDICASIQAASLQPEVPELCAAFTDAGILPIGTNFKSTAGLHALQAPKLVVPPVPSQPAPAAAEASPQSEETLSQRIISGYASDAWFSGTRRDGKTANTAALLLRDGAWFTAKAGPEQQLEPHRIVVPDAPGLRQHILSELHDTPHGGHFGVTKTQQALDRTFWWPTCRTDVCAFIASCASCQRVHARNSKKPGLLQPLQVPTRRWSSVSMDFITGLPITRSGHDAIVVFVDRLSKMARFAPTTTTVTAEGTAKLFFENVYRSHGLPSEIVSDRDPRFTSAFMRDLCKRMRTKQAMSTAYHPQTDGQTERMNRILEDYLRHFVAPNQNDWDDCLVHAEFAVNNAFQESIGASPFFLNYGQHPWTPLSVSLDSSGVQPKGYVPHASKVFQRMSHLTNTAKRHLLAAQSRQKAYADSKRADVTYKVGAMVLLSTQNLRLQGSRKLLPRFIGPFAITALVGKHAYRLDLPPHMHIHKVMHVSLLKPFKTSDRSQPLPSAMMVDADEEFEVESILLHRPTGRSQLEFLVRWKGYDVAFDTWEPQSNLTHAGDALSEYWRSNAALPTHST